jgi:hypothetical protein
MVIGKEKIVNVGSSRGRKASSYHCLTYIATDGDVKNLLLTDKEVNAGQERADKSTESIPRLGFWDKVCKSIFM